MSWSGLYYQPRPVDAGTLVLQRRIDEIYTACRFYGVRKVDLRGGVPLTRHILRFDIPLPASTESDLRKPNKEQLRADILAMRTQGMSYRRIASLISLHHSRVWQVVRNERNMAVSSTDKLPDEVC